jgi:hypothetical protein
MLAFYFFTKTGYRNEEVNCTERSASVRVPCMHYQFSYRCYPESNDTMAISFDSNVGSIK